MRSPCQSYGTVMIDAVVLVAIKINKPFVDSVNCSMHPYCIDLLCWLQENKVTGRKADVIQAAYLASELAQRLVKAGNEVRNFFYLNRQDHQLQTL